MEFVVVPFEYTNTIVEKVKLLAREITKENEDLGSIITYLSKVDASLDMVNQSLDPSQ